MSKKWLDDYMNELEKDNQQLDKLNANEFDSSEENYEDYIPRNPLDVDEDIEIDQGDYLEMDGTLPEIRYVIREFKKNHKVSEDKVELVMNKLTRFIILGMYSIIYTKNGYEYHHYTDENEVRISMDTTNFTLDYKSQLDVLSEEDRKMIRDDCKFYLSCEKLVEDNKESIEKELEFITKYPYSELTVGLLLGYDTDSSSIVEMN